MAIKTDYNFKGIEVKDAIIRVIRIFGSSKDGWNSLVHVYNVTKTTIPATDEVDEYTVETENLIEEFNFQVTFEDDERGYVSIYKALMDKYNGVEI